MQFKDKRILVTGGTGSMGQVLVRRILGGEMGVPKKIIVLSRDEAKQHYMRQEYLNRQVTTDEVVYQNFTRTLEFRIGDVRRYSDIVSAVRDADIVVNAAALKQVPTCEYFPEQALLTNCHGPMNIVRAIQEHNLPIETVVGISTDKACKPVNVMGMTKALQERVFTSANVLAPKTRFLCVRYGNVLASRGSVIPLFRDQILSGGPVTITVPDMTRFLLSIDQAVDTVFAAVRHGYAGETFIPRIPSATVINVAKAMIGDRKIETKITGIRPGEKMHEILISEEEAHRVAMHDKDFYVILPILPEIANPNRKPSKKPLLEGEYSSAGPVVDLAQTRELLKHHRLTMEDMVGEGKRELLR